MSSQTVYLINLSFGLAGIERRFANLWQVLRRRGNVRPILVVPHALAEVMFAADLADRGDEDLWTVPEHPLLGSIAHRRYPWPAEMLLAVVRSRAAARAYQPVWDRITEDPSAVIHIGMNCSALRPPDAPIVYECVDSTLSQLGTRHFVRASSRPSIVHCQTERIRQALEQTMANRRPKWRTVTSPCYFASYPSPSSHTPDRDPMLVAYVGRLDAEKSPLLFIDAIARVRAAGVPCRALILGVGPMIASMRQRIQQLALDSAIEVGFSQRPADRLLEATVFVSLQTGDNYGSQSLLEAMGAGCAVVATDVGETGRVVNENVGIRVRLDVVDVAAAILSLLTDARRASAMGAAAARLVRSEFTGDRYAAFVESLYARATEEYRSTTIQTECQA